MQGGERATHLAARTATRAQRLLTPVLEHAPAGDEDFSADALAAADACGRCLNSDGISVGDGDACGRRFNKSFLRLAMF